MAKRDKFARQTRRQSKSLLGKDNLVKEEQPKIQEVPQRKRILFRTYSLKKVSETDKHRQMLKDETICLKKRYVLKELVGKGKQGVVYSATDIVNNTKVAIKIVTNTDEERQRFQAEAKILKKIQKLDESLWYPQIYSIELKKRFYFIFELLGYSLMDIQTKYHSTQGFSLKVVLMIGIQLLNRIKTFHSLGLVHGDIKPANIMFGKGNKKHTLYLIDYGLSKKESIYTKSSPPDFVYQKQNLQLNGTPLYASINSHLGWSKMFKKDDMESFIYMLINIYKGKDLESLN